MRSPASCIQWLAVIFLSGPAGTACLTRHLDVGDDSRVWRSFENGETIGTRGSEDGAILLDEEHALGARITLESRTRSGRGSSPPPIPFAITCGIYGLFVHTCYFSHETHARNAYAEMKIGLDRILTLEAPEDAAGCERGNPVFAELDAFVKRFPT